MKALLAILLAALSVSAYAAPLAAHDGLTAGAYSQISNEEDKDKDKDKKDG
jgi:hypothetical protein